MQYWNLFNARALGSTHSAFYRIGDNKSFLLITSIILLLQAIIVEVGGNVFRTEPLPFSLLFGLFAVTSLVLLFGEIKRFIARRKTK
jgi:Ca2+-transporting ATPase